MLAMGRWGLRAVAKKSSIRTARWSSSSSQATNRQLLSALWIPTGGQKAVPKNECRVFVSIMAYVSKTNQPQLRTTGSFEQASYDSLNPASFTCFP